MQANEQVVVIQGDASKWYSQAVFIINPAIASDKVPVDFVAEAENIIHAYVEKNRGYRSDSIRDYIDHTTPITIFQATDETVVEKKRWLFRFDFVLYVLMVLACVAVAAVVSAGWLN